MFARIDRRRKIPVTSLMFALGLDGEQILSTFYKKINYKRAKEGWRVPFDATRFRGYSTINDLIDADSGKVVLEAGKKLTVRAARQFQEKGLKALRLSGQPTHVCKAHRNARTLEQSEERLARAQIAPGAGVGVPAKRVDGGGCLHDLDQRAGTWTSNKEALPNALRSPASHSRLILTPWV